jgi:hypothetical protein
VHALPCHQARLAEDARLFVVSHLLPLYLGLQPLERLAQVPPHHPLRHDVRKRAQDRARRLVAEPEVDDGRAVVLRPQAPARAVVEPGDARPRHVRGRLPLDDLDEPADVRGADVHAHRVARAEAAPLVALDVEARDAAQRARVALGVGDDVPDRLGRGVDRDLLVYAHQPMRGNVRSRESWSSVDCMRPST